MAETPFVLSVSDIDLQVLHTKLDEARLPDELEGAEWLYGAPLADIKRLLARWKDGFDWRAAEEKTNTIPQFTRDIEVDRFGTLNIHYIHQKSKVKNAIPLFFSHGCKSAGILIDDVEYNHRLLGSGHFLEVSKMLPLLIAAGEGCPSFHVVAYSLPGFGLSDAPKKKGFGLNQYAEVHLRQDPNVAKMLKTMTDCS